MPWASVVIALLALGAAPAAADELDRRIPASPGGLLQIDLDLGEEGRADRVSLDIRSHEADEVYAVADLSGLGGSTVEFRVEEDERGVRLYGRSGGLMSWLFGGPGVTVRVWVPRDFSIDARSNSGPIRIEDVIGDIRVRTTEGAIDLRAVGGELELHSATGAVTVNEARGSLSVRVSNADVELSWIEGETRVRSGGGNVSARHVEGRLEVRTDSGEIAVRDLRGPADVKTESGAIYAVFAGTPEGRLETHRGSVEVALPGHAGLALDARTRRGTVQILEGLQTNSKRGEHPPDHYAGSINGGGPALVIYTARGNIRVGRR